MEEKLAKLEEELVALRNEMQINIRRGLKIRIHEDWKRRTARLVERVRELRAESVAEANGV